jgi:hypothetical protein
MPLQPLQAPQKGRYQHHDHDKHRSTSTT